MRKAMMNYIVAFILSVLFLYQAKCSLPRPWYVANVLVNIYIMSLAFTSCPVFVAGNQLHTNGFGQACRGMGG